MDNVTQINRNACRFKTKICPILDGEFIYEAILVVLENCYSGKILEITFYSNFLLQSNYINDEKNTRLSYGKFITMFLNYLFFDREFIERSDKKVKNLVSIENLSIEDGNLFLNEYKNGKVGEAIHKRKDSIKAVERKLTNFYYYLYKNYKMKYLRNKDFTFYKTIRYKGSYKSSKKEINVLESPFTVVYSQLPGKTKLEYLSFYALSEFIYLAVKHYPIITLGIALQAFAGLRKGEVVNATHYNTQSTYMGKELTDWQVDLRVKPMLRSDGRDVGEIKQHKIAHVHPVFLPIFNLILKEHDKYLNEKLKVKNKFGAMFVNRYGQAMIEDSYERYFNLLVGKLINSLQKSGHPRAISEANDMMVRGFTTHTLRYFFSQYISSLSGTNIFDIAMFRRDSTLDASMRYIRNNPYLIDDKIEQIQNEKLQEVYNKFKE